VEVRVTASAGVAFFPDHGADGDELIQAADKALYVAKADSNCRYMLAEEVDSQASA
jgi:GGDEF domain-containing protein